MCGFYYRRLVFSLKCPSLINRRFLNGDLSANPAPSYEDEWKNVLYAKLFVRQVT